MKGNIFSFEEFSVYDGPGIRTSVFLKGCPLSCSWCHNPEGQSSRVQIVRSPNGCIHCGNCEKYAELTPTGAVFTKKSMESCPKGLLRECGELYTPQEAVERILKNAKLLKRVGGVTFSGGEPLYQSEFLFECLELLKGELHTAVQTSGFCSERVFKKALELSEYFLFDIKLVDPEEHLYHTGATNEVILNNFSLLCESKRDFTVRIPLIPGVTDTEKNLTSICELLKKHVIDNAEILPYNIMAGGKYKMLLREYKPLFDDTAKVEFHPEIFRSYGIKAKIL
ncbi:MAG: glycyl-radical enzyme activating protein [Ruminococcaceae bacterium]|nr:glycyl-radical enzyme activating protein [Oscillospiraceae bacterium]